MLGVILRILRPYLGFLRSSSNQQDDKTHGHPGDRSSISCHSGNDLCIIVGANPGGGDEVPDVPGVRRPGLHSVLLRVHGMANHVSPSRHVSDSFLDPAFTLYTAWPSAARHCLPRHRMTTGQNACRQKVFP